MVSFLRKWKPERSNRHLYIGLFICLCLGLTAAYAWAQAPEEKPFDERCRSHLKKPASHKLLPSEREGCRIQFKYLADVRKGLDKYTDPQDKKEGWTSTDTILAVVTWLFVALGFGVMIWDKYRVRRSFGEGEADLPCFPLTLEALMKQPSLVDTLPFSCARVVMLYNEGPNDGEAEPIHCDTLVFDTEGNGYDVEKGHHRGTIEPRAQQLAALLGVPYKFQDNWSDID